MYKEFSEFSQAQSLDITTSSEVIIDQADRVAVRVTGTNADKVRVSLRGVVLRIDDSAAAASGVTVINTGGGSYSSFNFGDGNVVMSGGSASMNINGVNIRVVNGVTYVNGKRIDTDETPQEKIEPLKIEVLCPPGLELDLTCRGSAHVASSPHFARARVNLSGSSSASIRSKSLSSNCSGCAQLVSAHEGGGLMVITSGSSSVVSRGSFQFVAATASGSSRIAVDGEVEGDFDASASGSASIGQRGKIRGSKSRNTSGCGQVTWF